ncbi:hypothetical protein [Sulfurovum sp.]|uniref:hypothetical protein n=1 Tax=Sulfurovum sp. TaxID=1969726 RepID=UPI0025E0E214|nr:hypothetical protein [Sulfurovum sp.]
MNSKTLAPYIKAAEQEGFNLFIDIQLGKQSGVSTVKETVSPCFSFVSSMGSMVFSGSSVKFMERL